MERLNSEPGEIAIHKGSDSFNAGAADYHLRRVLVVDDETDILEVLSAIMESQGYVVDKTCRAADALQKVMTCDYDAIVCDMVMPGFPGDKFYMAVSRVKPQLCDRFLFITGYGNDPAIRRFLDELDRPVLAKPIAMDDLLNALLGILN
ncbi:response regulator [Verrucomicrobiota bacterium sgz303538]